MGQYAIYKGEIYKMRVVGNEVEIISNLNKSIKYGFKQLKFEQGFISKTIYVKRVPINELDNAYELKYRVIYKGIEFIPWAVGRFILDNDKILLGTNDEKIAVSYHFEKIEQFVFKKEVSLEEIDKLIEIKKTILKFKNSNEEITIIEKEDIRDYINRHFE